MKVPVEQHYAKINGEFVLVSTKHIEVDKQIFAKTMAELIERSFKS